MQTLLDGIKPVLLFGAGPSAVGAAAHAALQKPVLGHLDPYFLEIKDDLMQKLRAIFHTRNEMTFSLPGTGSSGMEACFTNLVAPGDRVLVLSNGFFCQRMIEVASRLGAQVTALDVAWGKPILADAVKASLEKNTYDIVATVLAETSTGVATPVAEMGKYVRDHGALLIMDCVTGLGGMPVRVDEWHVDAAYSCTQKCLACPPGLSPVTFSERAMQKIRQRKNKVPNWYLDMTLLEQYWTGAKRVYHHTAPATMEYALYAGACAYLEEGETAVLARHQAAHAQLVDGLNKLGMEMLVEPAHRLPMINAVTLPKGVDDAAVRSRLRHELYVEIGAGLGPFAGKIWRIGVMGQNARPEPVAQVLEAIGKVL